MGWDGMNDANAPKIYAQDRYASYVLYVRTGDVQYATCNQYVHTMDTVNNDG